MNIKKDIINYVPFNEQEMRDKEYFLKFIETFDDVLTRNNIFGHFTASAFVVNKEHNKMLMVYHNIEDGWICPGGHADGENNLLEVALREVEEETGLKIEKYDDKIFAIQADPVKPHVKRDKFVSAHIHFDVIYLMEADDALPLVYREDESKGVKWFDFQDVCNSDVVSFIRPINQKLVRKLN